MSECDKGSALDGYLTATGTGHVHIPSQQLEYLTDIGLYSITELLTSREVINAWLSLILTDIAQDYLMRVTPVIIFM